MPPLDIPGDATETAVSILLPAADPAVDPWRARHDPARSWGVGAHVTVVFPWAPPDELDETQLHELASVVAATPATTCRLEGIGWFGDRVVWVRPHPAEWFRDLTAAIVERWPQWTPYSGAFPDPVPHLTIGQDTGREELAAAADDVARRLPITCPVERVQVLAGCQRPGGWRVVAELPLGPPVGSAG